MDKSSLKYSRPSVIVATDADGYTVKLDGKRRPTWVVVAPCQPRWTVPALKVTYSNGGTMQRENTFVLSSNGKTIKETDVTPAPMASTMSVMFKKS
jgi:hypothetical protein